MVFRGQLARRTQSLGGNNRFSRRLTGLSDEGLPGESKEIRDHLVVRGFLEGIRDSQVRLDLRKTIGDAEMNIEHILEMALHLEAVTRIEEEEKEPRVAVLQPDNNERLIISVNQLIEKLSLSREIRKMTTATVFRKGNNTEEVVQEIVIETVVIVIIFNMNLLVSFSPNKI